MQPIAVSAELLLQRFLEYAQIGTAADPKSDQYPSSPGQLALGRLLANQLLELGVADAHQDSNGLIWGTIPSNVSHPVPTILLNAHLDTSPEAPGDNCQPQVVPNYDGKPIVLKSGDVIDLESTPELAGLVGHTLVTTDGTTLLGADDKAGLAAIMQCVQTWAENPQIEHGPIRILFTCDEEIGRGTKHFDLAKAKADVGYTLDGGGVGVVDVETFSADGATVTFRGRNSHPSVAKGKMINSIRAASKFLMLLPSHTLTPETTSDRLGFIHPYTIHGGVHETTIQFILRDFDTPKLEEYANLLKQLSNGIVASAPGLEAQVDIVRQYRNMADVLRRNPRAIELAEQAYRDLGIPCKRDSIRGGTDGALMSELGLPTPNLSVGQYNIHSVREFASMNQMQQAAQHAIRLCELWATA
jgi:tripeptide aminopeptidase